MSDEIKNKETEHNQTASEMEQEGLGTISMPLALMMVLFAFGIGLVIGGYFLPLGERGKAAADGKSRGGDARVAKANTAPGQAKRLKLTIPADAPYIGPKDAPVTIVAFDDFQCPFCRRFADALHKAMEKYPKDVRFVFINFPLRRIHKSAQLAAEVGMEAMAQGKFRQMHDKLFANQRQITRENVMKWAKEIGMDTGKLKQALDSGKWKKAIDAHLALGRRIGVRGTPTVLLNGRWFRSYRANEVIKAIEEELALIKKRHIPRGKAWQVLTANGVKTIAELRGKKNNRKRDRRRRKTLDPNVRYKITFTDQDPWRGTKDALVTIVEFSDYQCPFCRRVEGTIDQLLKDYQGKVKLVYLQNPLFFHKNARALTNAALEVLSEKGMDAFWKFHKLVFEHQRDVYKPDFMNVVKKFAQQVGADPAKVEEAAKTDKHKATIARHQALARKFMATGTPAFFINGYNLRGAQPIERFKAIIDRELKKAEEAIKAGKATPQNYYDFIMKTASAAPKFIGGDSKRPPRPRLDTSKVYKVFPIDGLPYYGDPKAQVVMAGAFDLQCPFCARLAPTVIKLMKGDPNAKPNDPKAWHGYKKGVKFVFLHFPLRFHKDSQLAHEALQEVFEQKGPEAFFKYMEIIYQGKNYRSLPRQKLEEWAQQLGCDMNKFKKALDTHKHAAFIKKMEQMAQQIGVRGTPTVYVNGKQVRGRTLEIYRATIDKALKEAQDYLKAHTNVKPEDYYAEIMKTAEPKAIWITPGQNAKRPPVRKIPPFQIKGAMGAPNGQPNVKIQMKDPRTGKIRQIPVKVAPKKINPAANKAAPAPMK